MKTTMVFNIDIIIINDNIQLYSDDDDENQ